MRKIGLIIFIVLIGLAGEVQAQSARHYLREGNRHYKKQRYEQAEDAYRHALELDSTDARCHYNLGNALYRQKKYEEADSHYTQMLASPTATQQQRARAFHNRGNTCLKRGMENNDQQLLQQALSSYQEALKLDPKNDDTRYNLALARHLLKQAQQQQQQGGGNGGGNNDQQQNQQQNQQNQGNNQQQNNNQQNQQGQQQQQQNGQNGQNGQQAQQDMKKRDAERLLEAMGNRERQTLRERERTDLPARGKKAERDW